MKAWPVLVIALLLLPAVTSQSDSPVREVAFHQFQQIWFEDLQVLTSCETGGFVAEQAGLLVRFDETIDNNPVAGQSRDLDPFLTSGCATLRTPLEVPSGTDHVVVRFEASRERTEFNEAINAGAPLTQDLVVRDAGLREVQSRAVYDPGAPGSEFQPFQFTFVGSLGGNIFLDWVFVDPGFSPQSPVNPASGQAFGGAIRMATLEAVEPARSAQVRSETKDIRDGTRLTTQHSVMVDVAPFSGNGSSVHVRVASGLDLARVIGPDGQDLGAPATDHGGALGYDHSEVVVGLHAEHTQAVVPQAAVERHGPGTYVFVFEKSRGLEVSTALVPVSVLLLATPLPFAVLAWIESRAFRREAFGGYARSARNLQYGVGLVFLYYAAVVASAAVGGRLDLMAVIPLPLEGVLLYVQLVLAGIAFTALWLVARELYLLVKPRPASALDDAF